MQFYIDGQWVAPLTSDTLDVINPATEQPIETIAMGGADDVDAAVAAAKAAFETFSLTSKEERLALLDSIIGVYAGRMEELADIISQEVGAPLWLAQAAQAAAGLGHLATARAVLADFEFERPMGTTLIVREPVGVCGMITPWNWPLNQIACKVAPGDRGGLHDGAQAVRGRAAERDHLRGDHGRGRRARRRVQPRERRRRQRRRAARRRTPTSTWCRSPVRPAPASRSPAPRRRR